jgi:hypothetical protein
MTNRRISTCVMTALVAALAIFVATGTADEHSGTLKMNRAKSKNSPGSGAEESNGSKWP